MPLCSPLLIRNKRTTDHLIDSLNGAVTEPLCKLRTAESGDKTNTVRGLDQIFGGSCKATSKDRTRTRNSRMQVLFSVTVFISKSQCDAAKEMPSAYKKECTKWTEK